VEVQDFQYSAELVATSQPEEEPKGLKMIHVPDELEIASIPVKHVDGISQGEIRACTAETCVFEGSDLSGNAGDRFCVLQDPHRSYMTLTCSEDRTRRIPLPATPPRRDFDVVRRNLLRSIRIEEDVILS
jgi:hypothetical protein